MRTGDDERFRPRPGKPRSRGNGASRRFVGQVLRAAQASAAGVAKPLARAGRGRGAEKGRGHVTARLAGDRLGPRARRVVVKARLVVLATAAPGSTAAHLRYIQREGATRGGEPGQAYGPATDRVDVADFEERGRGDRHQFRFIVSPEDAAEIDDLRGYTRGLMARVEADLGTRLDWVAVDHWDTDNPHTHVVLRGADERGRDLVIARDYVAHGFRARAAELATEWLGPQTEREVRERMDRDVASERWTGLDRRLTELARGGAVDLSQAGTGAEPAADRGRLLGRLQTLERFGLATREDGGRWSLAPDAEATLRAMGERGDIVRAMQRALRDEPRALAAFPDGDGHAAPVVGRIAGKGLADEHHDRGYLVVDGIDGRAHYVRLPAGADLSTFPVGGIAEVHGRAEAPRAADRAIAAVAVAASTGPTGISPRPSGTAGPATTRAPSSRRMSVGSKPCGAGASASSGWPTDCGGSRRTFWPEPPGSRRGGRAGRRSKCDRISTSTPRCGHPERLGSTAPWSGAVRLGSRPAASARRSARRSTSAATT